jgi:kynurenine formamidase
VTANPFHARPICGRLPEPGEYGSYATPSMVARACALVQTGEIYDLDVGRWPGAGEELGPPFEVASYTTPQSLRLDDRFGAYTDHDPPQGFLDEVVMGSAHVGTHVDALSHVTVGRDDSWYGGYSANDHLGTNGPRRADSTAIPPMVTRGILMDVAGRRGGRRLPSGYVVEVEDLERCLAEAQLTLEHGDVALVRTGWIHADRGPDARTEPGLSVAAARWLVGRGVVAIGSDNAAVEPLPSPDPAEPMPVHVVVLSAGVYLIEQLYLDAVAEQERREFLFICSSPKTRGTSGSHARPLAVL